MSSDTDDLLRSIDACLKLLLRLKIGEPFGEDATNRDKVKVLYQLGFDTAGMADVMGTTEGSIRATKSDLRSDGEIE